MVAGDMAKSSPCCDVYFMNYSIYFPKICLIPGSCILELLFKLPPPRLRSHEAHDLQHICMCVRVFWCVFVCGFVGFLLIGSDLMEASPAFVYTGLNKTKSSSFFPFFSFFFFFFFSHGEVQRTQTI